MKIAFHFDSQHESLATFYGLDLQKKIFKLILNHRSLSANSKVFVGDLLMMMIARDKTTINETQFTYSFSEEKYLNVFYHWANPQNVTWKRYSEENIEHSFGKDIYVICFESIDLKTAEYLNKELESNPSYLGAMEVDDSSEIHWILYSQSLIALGRIHNDEFNLFHQPEDDTEDLLINDYQTFGFKKVNPESLNGRYTIFDTYSNFEEARRIAEWKRNSGGLLAFIADEIVSKLSDIAPDIGNKLWSALKTFEDSETNEQLAQVTASCRRIFEYVVDCIFPPSNEKMDGHSLKADKYKNRLFAYADTSRKSSTNIDLIVATTKTLFEQWDKLNSLANKGVHSEVFRTETRRCLLRTIMLLDDIVSLKEKPFDIKPNLNFDDIFGENASG